MISIFEHFFTLLMAIQDNALALFALVAVPSLGVVGLALMVALAALRKNK